MAFFRDPSQTHDSRAIAAAAAPGRPTEHPALFTGHLTM